MSWQPIKPSSEYTDEEVIATELYQAQVALNGELSQPDVLALTRDNIDRKWAAMQDEKRRETVENIDRMLRDLGEEATQVIIDRETKTIIVHKAKPKVRRWRAEDYAARIGGVYRKVHRSNNPARAGEYVLHIEPPHPGSSVPFKTRVVCPSGLEVAYPPRDPENPQMVEGFYEATSMGRMMKMSSAATAHSPAVFFGLK